MISGRLVLVSMHLQDVDISAPTVSPLTPSKTPGKLLASITKREILAHGCSGHGCSGCCSVAYCCWFGGAGRRPSGTQTEMAAIEEADVHESLNRFLEEKEANAVALVEDWERKSPASEASLSEAGDASEESVAAYINRSYRVPLEEARQLTAWALEIGQGFDVDPLLILSVAATESSFNPKPKTALAQKGSCRS